MVRKVVLPARPIPLAAAFCGFMAFALTTSGQVAPDRLADLEGAITAAEGALRDGDLLGRQDDALIELQAVLNSRPEFADARYLLGKTLLSRDAAEAAATHLEAAARLAPDEANIHYQLARAYEQLGRPELARQELATYQQLKEKRRAKTP